MLSLACLFCLVVCHVLVSVHCYAPIDVKLDFKAHQIHRVDTLNILAYTLLLIATVVTIWIFKVKRFKYMHETQLTIIYGLIAGAIIKYVGEQGAEFTYLRVVPSGPRPFENTSISPNQSAPFEANPVNQLNNQLNNRPTGQNELIISTNVNRNLTSLIRNQANVSLEQLNKDFPLNGGVVPNNSAPVNSSFKVDTIQKSKAELKDDTKPNDLTALKSTTQSNTQSTTVKHGNSTVELTTQQATPITENSLKPTLPLNKESLPKNVSSIRPTSSSALSKDASKDESADQAKNKNSKNPKANKTTPKKMAASKESGKESKERPAVKPTAVEPTAIEPTKLSVESKETNDLNKLIKINQNSELTLKLQAPPDALYVNLNIIKEDRNVSSKKNYIYIFKGEFAKGELVSHDDEQMVADVYSSQRAIFDPEFFFNIIIPLIIFNAGYSLKRRFFFHNLGS